jgi:hypothetical protein
VSNVWTDKVFRQRLRTDPRAGLLELGIEVPPGVQVKTIASKGSPSDVDDASLLQFLLESQNRSAYFFLPSPRSPCAQQAVFGKVISRELGDPVFAERLLADAAAALHLLAVAP